MALVKADVVLSSCNDERYPPICMLDGKPNTFFVTTGLFPHEVIIGMRAGAANIRRISLSSSGIKKLRIEKCTDLSPLKFEAIVDCEIANRENSSRQLEQFQVNAATAGAGVTFLKIVIVSGHETFAAVFDLAVEGENVGGA